MNLSQRRESEKKKTVKSSEVSTTVGMNEGFFCGETLLTNSQVGFISTFYLLRS